MLPTSQKQVHRVPLAWGLLANGSEEYSRVSYRSRAVVAAALGAKATRITPVNAVAVRVAPLEEAGPILRAMGSEAYRIHVCDSGP